MLRGGLALPMLRFTIPVILTGILQLLFHACDLAVAGRFAGSEALAAVGCTTHLANLLVNTILGLSIGANVVAARSIGAGDRGRTSRTAHTAMALSLLCGALLAGCGPLIARPCLEMMSTPADIMAPAVDYLAIYFFGMPGMMVFSFTAALLRAQGEARKPLVFLTIAGVANVLLNLLFVIGFHMAAEGVALATAISQLLSAALIVRHIMRTPGACRIRLGRLRFHGAELKSIVYVGVPSGLNSTVFSLSNIQVQSAINSFGASAVAGCAAAGSMEGFVYLASNSQLHTSTVFTGQNAGAGQWARIPRILWISLLYVTIIDVVLGGLSLLFGGQLLSLYTSSPQDIAYGMARVTVLMAGYYVCGYMEVFTGMLRGLGYAITPTVVTLTCVCGFRFLWVYGVFPHMPELWVLFLCFPISWIIATAAHATCYFVAMRRKAMEDTH